ncbi:cupin domain-containing protein [Mariniflexile gromovii]|uniref:Cupin domain-containing protein n=1 Tax=Mariniflexile gromovii TaxID=362523 RepID=A0ABS4BRP7_9FLAO|nr:cupin domain-containing protein [Mariniflexile gromovii]MBP0903257.1 cupin domain-containing protein [Mariniflexile gromovii]
MKNYSTKWVLGHKITTYDTTGDYDLMMAETPAMVQGPPPHIHNNFKESFLVVEGEMEFFINGEVKNIKAGELVDIPPKSLHTFSNKSNSTCKWVNIHSPKGFSGFFDTLGIPAENENAQQTSIAPENFQKVMEIAEEFDMIIKV